MYSLPESYISNPENDFFDDTSLTDAYQKEVYEHARRVADRERLCRVIDIGCGSAYKLIKNFEGFDTIGIDLPPTVEWLKKTYPKRTWIESNFDTTLQVSGLVIASDVIEHLPDPDRLMAFVRRLRAGGVIVLSTPERARLKHLQTEWREQGPPVNPAHVR